jgi:dTDP-4-dehydrorhamnose 3,5-epimerase
MNAKPATFVPLRRIEVAGGDVYHGMKASEASYAGFGEAYFTTAAPGAIKGWKRHNRMTLNLIVPAGAMQICVRSEQSDYTKNFQLGFEAPAHYGRLTIPPGLWVAFGGLGSALNLMLNVASIEHDPLEADNAPLDTFPWSWGA